MIKAVKFALNALNEFNSNTNFSPKTTVFFRKCSNWKQSRYQLSHFLPHFHRIFTEFNSPKIKNLKFWITGLFAHFLKLWIRRIFWREFTEFNSLEHTFETSNFLANIHNFTPVNVTTIYSIWLIHSITYYLFVPECPAAHLYILSNRYPNPFFGVKTQFQFATGKFGSFDTPGTWSTNSPI